MAAKENLASPGICRIAPKIVTDDEAGGDVHRRAKDTLERHVKVPDQPLDRIAAMRPGRRQILAE